MSLHNISTQLGKIEALVNTQTDFINEVLEIIYQVSGVNLATTEVVWKFPRLTIKATPAARNLILRHREKIITLLYGRFDRLAPQVIR